MASKSRRISALSAGYPLTAANAKARWPMFFLYPGERIVAAILALLGVALLLSLALRPVEVAWPVFIGGFVFYGMVLVTGLWLRLIPRLHRVSVALVALGFYPIFASVLALVNYLQFPLGRPLIDPLLMRLDAGIGYDWAAAVAWLADRPQLSKLMAASYLSALGQLGLVLLVLGLTGRIVALHRLLVTGMLASCATVAFWTAFPSIGPAAFVLIEPEIAARAGLLVTNDYGAFLRDLVDHGLRRIDGHQMLGTVAFPSFHIVMALLAMWFARGTWLFWPCVVNLILMTPATAIHGGHHAVDLAGGLALFVGAAWIAARLLPDSAGQAPAPRPVPAPAGAPA